MSHPLQMFYENFLELGKKVEPSNEVKFGNEVMSQCDVLSMEGVPVYGHTPECRLTIGVHIFTRSLYRP